MSHNIKKEIEKLQSKVDKLEDSDDKNDIKRVKELKLKIKELELEREHEREAESGSESDSEEKSKPKSKAVKKAKDDDDDTEDEKPKKSKTSKKDKENADTEDEKSKPIKKEDADAEDKPKSKVSKTVGKDEEKIGTPIIKEIVGILHRSGDIDRYSTIPDIPCKRLLKEAILPTRATEFSAGYDLYATEDYTLKVGERHLFKSGWAMAIPVGYVGEIWPRSGTAVKNGIDTMAGVIDSDYRHDIGIELINLNSKHNRINEDDDLSFKIKKGDRIAQLLIKKTESPKFVETTDDLPTANSQRSGGFGSTGS